MTPTDGPVMSGMLERLVRKDLAAIPVAITPTQVSGRAAVLVAHYIESQYCATSAKGCGRIYADLAADEVRALAASGLASRIEIDHHELPYVPRAFTAVRAIQYNLG